MRSGRVMYIDIVTTCTTVAAPTPPARTFLLYCCDTTYVLASSSIHVNNSYACATFRNNRVRSWALRCSYISPPLWCCAASVHSGLQKENQFMPTIPFCLCSQSLHLMDRRVVQMAVLVLCAGQATLRCRARTPFCVYGGDVPFGRHRAGGFCLSSCNGYYLQATFPHIFEMCATPLPGSDSSLQDTSLWRNSFSLGVIDVGWASSVLAMPYPIFRRIKRKSRTPPPHYTLPTLPLTVCFHLHTNTHFVAVGQSPKVAHLTPHLLVWGAGPHVSLQAAVC